MKKLDELFHNAGEATRSGSFSEAIGFYEEILKLSSRDPKAQHLAHWGIGDIHLNHKNYPQAELHLKKAIELNPNEGNYHYLLGCNYTYTNEIDKAIHHLQTALKLKPDHAVILGQLGWVIGYNRDAEEGIKYLKKSLSLNPKNLGSLKDICMLYAKSEKLGEAIVCIEEAIKHNPDDENIEEIKKTLEFFRSELKRLKH